MLPRLRAGVWVHFHEIDFPYDYTRDVLDGDPFFRQERTLLYAFLTGNTRYRLELSLSMVHYSAAQDIARARRLTGCADRATGTSPARLGSASLREPGSCNPKERGAL